MTVVVVVEVLYLHNPMIIGKKQNDVFHSEDNDEIIRLSPLSQFLQFIVIKLLKPSYDTNIL